MEEVVMELVLAYTAESKDGQQSDLGISKIIERLIDLLSRDADNLQTRVVFRCLLNNTVKMRFEEDFTKDKKPIKRIRELLEWKKVRESGLIPTASTAYAIPATRPTTSQSATALKNSAKRGWNVIKICPSGREETAKSFSFCATIYSSTAF